MQRAVDEARARIADNPRLARLEGMIDADRCSALRSFEHDLEGAQPFCARALRFGYDPRFAEAQLDLLRAQDKDEEAARLAEKILGVSPQREDALWVRSGWWIKQKHYRKAARDLEVLRQLDSTDKKKADRAAWLVSMLRYQGDQLRKQQQVDAAAEHFQLALRLAPDDHDLRVRLAHADRGSLTRLQARVAANPDDFDAHVRLDGALAVQRRFPEIIAMWDGYVARQPREGRAYYERGGAKHHAGQRDGAIADLRKACELGFDPACTDLRRLGAR